MVKTNGELEHEADERAVTQQAQQVRLDAATARNDNALDQVQRIEQIAKDR